MTRLFVRDALSKSRAASHVLSVLASLPGRTQTTQITRGPNEVLGPRYYVLLSSRCLSDAFPGWQDAQQLLDGENGCRSVYLLLYCSMGLFFRVYVRMAGDLAAFWTFLTVKQYWGWVNASVNLMCEPYVHDPGASSQ